MNDMVLHSGPIRDPMAFVKEVGKSIAQSEMIPGIDTMAKGEVIAMECLFQRTTVLSLRRRYHFIKGNMTDRADAMLGMFCLNGGHHKVLERTANRAAIRLTCKGETCDFDYSWEDALGEPATYDGKEQDVVDKIVAGKLDKLKVKKKYATPRARMQMLWSRVTTDGIRTMMPEIIFGKYGEGETADFTNSNFETQEFADAEFVEAESSTVTETTSASATETNTATEESATASTATSSSTGEEPDSEAEPGFCTGEQAIEIRNLYVTLGVPYETQEAILAKRNAKTLRNLTSEQAEEILVSLRAKVAKVEDSVADQQSQNTTGDHEPLDTQSPCTQEQIEKMRTLYKECEQAIPGTGLKVAGRLTEFGMKKLSDLSVADADIAIQCFAARNMEAFFERSLTKPVAQSATEQTETATEGTPGN